MQMRKMIPTLLLFTVAISMPCSPVRAEVGKESDKETVKESSKIDPLVLTVNGIPVTRSDVDRIIALMVTQLPKHMETEKLKAKTEESARDKMVEITLLFQAGSKSLPADFDKQLEELFQEKRSKFTTVAGFEFNLKKLGMTEAEYRNFLRRELIVNNFIKTTYIDKITITDQEIADFYKEKKDGFKIREESRKVSHILVPVDAKATDDQKKAARAKADRLHDRVVKGEDFAEVARKESSDVTARLGGSLDFISKGQMPPPFEKAAYALKKGEISGVVETPLGLHIIQLNDISAAEFETLANVKEKIKDHLKNIEAKKRLNSYLATAKKSAVITVADNK